MKTFNLFIPREINKKEIKNPCCSLTNVYYKEEKGWEYFEWRCRNCGYFFRARRFIDGIEIPEAAYIPQIIGLWKYFLYYIGFIPQIISHNPLPFTESFAKQFPNGQAVTDALNGCSCQGEDCEKCN